MPDERSWLRSTRVVAIGLVVALLAVVAFSIGRAVLDRSPANRAPAKVTSVPQQADALGTMAQLNAFLSTPAGQAALAREFAPGSFGARSSTPSEPSPIDKCRLGQSC
jgi:hypothetical protein